MANSITIDVEARFVDRVTAGMNAAAKSTDKFEKSVEKANRELDKASKKNVKPRLGADDNAFTKKIRQAQSRLDKLGKTKAAATLGVIDRASSKLGELSGKARAWSSKSFQASLTMADKASRVLGNVTGAARSFAGKTFSAAVKIVDYATTPLRKIKESLFSIKTLVAAITAGFATKKFVMDPINLADSYSSAQIGFSTLLGETKGQAMMDDIDAFAKATPFKTAGIISNVQKMMAYGWDASRVIKDMETIGDAAAATGKGDEGLESIVYALSEIRSKGKLSTQELNQLASAGIKAKQYLAQGLGYGTDDAGMAKLMEDLEDGAVGANQAIELILQGMEEFDGMMDKTANETVEGLWSQIEDTFEINIFRRWGQGLQDGAKKGLGSIVDLLNTSEDALSDFGDMLYDIGKEISNWGAGRLENFVSRVKAITQSNEFKNASLGGKIKLLWEGTILDPLKKWWNSDAVQSWLEEKKEWLADKVQGWGESIGTGLSNGLLTLLGVDVTGMIEEGASIGASFAEGFAEGFDGSAVTEAIVKAVKNAWSALPTWAQVLIGGYVGGKVVSGISGAYLNTVGAIGNIAGHAKTLIGTPGNAMVRGTGLSSLAANAGYAMTGGAAASTLSGTAAALAGTAGIAGTALGVYGLYSGGKDIYRGAKADTSTKLGKEERAAYVTSGVSKVGLTAAGAAIGTAILPGLGTAIGAGLGYLGGKFFGDKAVKDYEKMAKEAEKAKYESQEMKDAIEDGSYSAEEMQAIFEDACWDDMKSRFGDIKLSMEEINKLAETTVFGGDKKFMEKYAKAADNAEKSLKNYQEAAADMDRLNFDMSEYEWKFNFGLETKMSDEEIENVKSRVQNYIESAEQLLSDQHYKFNAAVEVLLKPKEGEENSAYEQIIQSGNSYFVKVQEELNNTSQKLTAQYEIALEDGVITADEQKILSELQGKIAEIVEKISNAETEASFEVAKIKFTTGDLTPESFADFNSTLQTQLNNYVAEQDEALTYAISQIKLQLENDPDFTQDDYDTQLTELLKNYNTNIDTMTANVNKVQLEGIAEAFDGVGTVEELQSAINDIIAEGKDPVDVTFSDINAKLDIGDDVLSEEAKANFTSIMQSAIESAATGENALKSKAEVDPTLQVDEEKLGEKKTELNNYLTSQLEGTEDDATTITPTLKAAPEITFEEGTAEGMKSELETQVSSYLTGENSLTTTANVYAARQMFGAGGIPLSEEASKGRTDVKGAIDTAFTDPFSASADANITLNWKISNPTTTLSFSGGGGNGSTISASVGGNAAGGIITGGPQLSWLDEENMGEAVIPFNPSRRARALQLYAETGRRLGILNNANGGIIGDDFAPITPYNGEIQSSGDQKIEINMGGVTIEIKADGNKSMAQNIEDQEQEIAEKVATIFKNVMSAQFANMPLKGTT